MTTHQFSKSAGMPEHETGKYGGGLGLLQGCLLLSGA